MKYFPNIEIITIWGTKSNSYRTLREQFLAAYFSILSLEKEKKDGLLPNGVGNVIE